MYAKYIKRILDFILSLLALIILSPLLIIMTIVGAIAMKGNPFFVQERPGKDEKIFKLIKFRTMTCEKDKDGNLLPDEKRLNRYGAMLRSTSGDELLECINILKGDMAIVGPRPLLVRYLSRYNEEQRHRHDVRPGLTGLAQVNGRNAITWEDKFRYDLEYIKNMSFGQDAGIIFRTIKQVFRKDGINNAEGQIMEEFIGNADINELKNNNDGGYMHLNL